MKRWPLKKAYFWETAPFFRALLPFALGIICYDKGWFTLPVGCAITVVCISFALYLILALTQKGGLFLSFTSFLLLNTIMFFSGGCISSFNDVRNNQNWFANNLNTKATYLACIADAPSEKEHSWKITVNIVEAIANTGIKNVCGKAFLYVFKDGSAMLYHKGDSILVPGNWQPIKNAGNPYEFNYAGYCQHNNIYYEQSCTPNNIRLYALCDPVSVGFTAKAHDWCIQQLDKYIPDSKTRGLMQAMLLGDEINLDKDLRQTYSDTGIIHIIAISGSHVTMVFIIISSLFWWLANKRHLWIKYVAAIPLVWLYVLMAGASPSAIRAALMFSLFACSIIFQKNSNNLNLLFSAAFLVLCAQPTWLFSEGFQLSFVAVLSIILFYRRIYSCYSPANKIAGMLWTSVAASIAVEILIAPLVIYYFHTFSLVFMVTNVLAYMFMGVAITLGTMIIALSIIPPVAQLIGKLTILLVALFNHIILWMQGIDPAPLHFLVLKNIELVMMYMFITGIAVFLIKRQKSALFVGLSVACLLMVSFCQDEWANLHRRSLVIYHSTKSQVELINNKTYTVLYTDSANLEKTAYTIAPAHINWAANLEKKAVHPEVVDLDGKTLLLLNTKIDSSGRFPVSYLFINHATENNAVKLQKIFSPSLIIIGDNVPQTQAEKLADACTRNHIHVHIIAKDGAFVMNY